MMRGRLEQSPGISGGFFLAVLAIWSVLVIRMFYGIGTGEHDAYMMASGIVQGLNTDEILNPFCYGTDMQFLYYYIAHLGQGLIPATTESVLLWMNAIGTLCMLAIPLMLGQLFTRLTGDSVRAQVTCLLFMTTPIYMMLVSYGHPFHLAWAVSLAAWLLFLAADRTEAGAARIVWIAAAIVLQAMALATRVEQVLIFALFVVGLRWLNGRRSLRETIAVSAFLLIPVILFVAMRVALNATADAESSSATLGERLSLLLRGLDPNLVQWSLGHFIMEVGAALLVLAFLLGIVETTRRNWIALTVAIFGIAPTLLVYAGNPSPPRHFTIAALGVACLAATAVATWAPMLRAVVIVTVLFANVLAPWALLRFDRDVGGGRVAVSYNVFERRDRNYAQISASGTLYRRILESADQRPVAVFGNWIHVSQMIATIVGDPDYLDPTVERLQIPVRLQPVVIRTARGDVYLIEAYDQTTVREVSGMLRGLVPGLLCISLVQSAPEVNDFTFRVLEPIYWWNS